MSYRQLTEGQRYQISAFLSQEFSQREIARKLDVAPSTIHRELRRNKDKTESYDLGAHVLVLWQRSVGSI